MKKQSWTPATEVERQLSNLLADLLDDVEGMRSAGEFWLGGFSVYDSEGDTVHIEWPNIVISAAHARSYLKKLKDSAK